MKTHSCVVGQLTFMQDRVHVRGERRHDSERALHWTPLQEVTMLWTLALILFVLWLLGTVSAYTMGGFIHALLVLALILVVLNLFTGTRRAAL